MVQSYGRTAQPEQHAFAIRFCWLSGDESWAGFVGYPTFVESFASDFALIFSDRDDAHHYVHTAYYHVCEFARIERCQLGKAE